MRIPAILAIILFAISLLVDVAIAIDVRNSFRKKWPVRAYWVSAAACWAFLIVILCLPRRDADADIQSVMWMLYIYLSVYLAKIAYVICSLIGRLVRTVARIRIRRHPARAIGLILAVCTGVVMALGPLYTRRHIVTERVDISSPMIPRPFDGFKIAQISDLHVGTWGNDTTFISTLVDSVNSLHPDLIVFTGDIVNRKTSELYPFVNVLSRLKAPYGVMSILGNHDYGDYVDWKTPADRTENNKELSLLQRKMGWDLLNNERRLISTGNDSIMIIGVENVGDPPFPTYGDLEAALSASSDSAFNQNDRRFKVLLTHNPEHWNQEVADKTNIGLTLTGHTHAMQVMTDIGGWKWSPAKWRYPLWGGLYERLNNRGEKTLMYVNIGAGEVGMPARLISAYPEITLFTLHHQGH